MTQGIDCEPSLSLAVSRPTTGRLLDDLTFAVLPSVRSGGGHRAQGKDAVMLDGDAIDDSLFMPAGGGYEVARVPMPECLREPAGLHAPTAGRFGMTMRGMDIVRQLRADRADLEGAASIPRTRSAAA